MTIHIISVGTSIYDALRQKKGQMFDPPIGGTQAPNAPELAKTLKRVAPTEWLDHATTQTLRSLTLQASAETATFLAQNRAGGGALLEGDTAILLASDTRDGLCSAVWTASRLTEPDRITYHDEAGLPLTAGRLTIIKIPGLDARRRDSFEASMRHLGEVGAAVIAMNTTVAPVAVHLSGGYKAAVPFLIAMAEGLRALQPDVTALCLFEGQTVGGEVIDPIPIPLRKLDQKALQAVATALPNATARCEQDPASSLSGYTHTLDTQEPELTWMLTPFGQGLVAMRLDSEKKKVIPR